MHKVCVWCRHTSQVCTMCLWCGMCGWCGVYICDGHGVCGYVCKVCGIYAVCSVCGVRGYVRGVCVCGCRCGVGMMRKA